MDFFDTSHSVRWFVAVFLLLWLVEPILGVRVSRILGAVLLIALVL